MHEKFDNLWIGPYLIESEAGNKSFILATLEGQKLPLPINGYLLKPYFQEGTLPLACSVG
jgi:hypothetical protein